MVAGTQVLKSSGAGSEHVHEQEAGVEVHPAGSWSASAAVKA